MNRWIRTGSVVSESLCHRTGHRERERKEEKKENDNKIPFRRKRRECVVCVCCSIIAAKRKVAHGLGYRLIENWPFFPPSAHLAEPLRAPTVFFFSYLASCVTCLAVVAE